ncbi:MAG: hypothetical protein AAGG11_17900 [Pseudomonadota bacterium]
MRTVLLLTVVLLAGAVRAELLTEARDQLISGDLAAARQSYTAALSAAATTAERLEALEYLGVTLERDGDAPGALARYRAVLEDPTLAETSARAQRVRQRIRAVLALLSPSPASSEVAPAQRVILRGALSQEILSDRFRTDDGIGDGSSTVAATTLNLGGSLVTRRGNLSTAVDATWLQPIETEGDGDTELWLPQAWLQWLSPGGEQRLRVGRQQLSGLGTYGRVDAALYERPVLEHFTLGLAAGLPVLAPGYAAEPDQPFIAGRVSVDLLDGRLGLAPYFNIQRNESLVDREAVGVAARFHAGRLRVAAEVDVDVGYRVLNLGLLDLGLDLNQRLSLFARARVGASPFLLTGNALRGQRTDDLATLAAAFTEAELRALARARTADEVDLSTGGSLALSSRWFLTAGVRYEDRSRVPGAAGATALPASQSLRSWFNLAGNSVLLRNDALYLRYSLDSRLDADEHRGTIEWRLPLLRGWQVAPLLSIARREAVQAVRNRTTLAPGLRLSGRWQERYQLDLLVEQASSEELMQVRDQAVAGSSTRAWLSVRIWL